MAGAESSEMRNLTKEVSMRRVIVTTNVTLDGVIDSPEKWSLRYFNDEYAKHAQAQLFAADALLLGRETYEGFAAAWPTMSDEEGFAETMNSLPKHVASRTLEGPLEWNATLIEGDVAEGVSELKKQPGKDILMYGCGELARTLARAGLIDEFRMWVHPVVWGSGERLFGGEGDETFLEHAQTTPLSSGIVILSYRPARDG